MKANTLFFSFLLMLSFNADVFAQSFCEDDILTIDPLESITLAPEELIISNDTLVMSKFRFDILVNHPDTELEAVSAANQQLALDMVVKMNAPVAIGIEAVLADENSQKPSVIGQDLRIIVAVNAVSSAPSSLEFTEYFVATMKITALPSSYTGGEYQLSPN